MISNARGKHSSPGVYMQEIDKTYASRSLGVTTLGGVGETLKGPAFQPIRINDWNEFQDYFGGTSTEKFKGTGYPKYELPYIAKSYLQESKQLDVCRVLGLSGYRAGKAFVIYSTDNTTEKTIIAILRSKASYTSATSVEDICNGSSDFDKLTFDVDNFELKPATTFEMKLAGCANATTDSTTSSTITANTTNYGKFTLNFKNNNEVVNSVCVSLNPGDKDYIINVLGMSAQEGDYPMFVEEMYDLAHINKCDNLKDGENLIINGEVVTNSTVNNYLSQFREAVTPWFVSEMKGTSNKVDLKKLFRFHTISDGNSANSQIKISIANILPDEGLFDVLIRDFNDLDASPVVLERYNKCSMVPGSSNYIGLKIGTFNGDYMNKSKYVTVEVIENDMTETCVPCGFLGYPLRTWETGFVLPELPFNTSINEDIKYNRQYFGMSDITGVDLDILMFKGKENYYELQTPANGYTNGFHLDSYLNIPGESGVTFTVDGQSGYTFTTPDNKLGNNLGATKAPHIASEGIMEGTVYEDKRLRKFTCYPYGGFDGWDIYRAERSNTDMFRGNKYKGKLNTLETDAVLSIEHPFTSVFDASSLRLSGKFNNSDYYAYLAGYKQFDNPSETKINLLVTPGIDYVNNLSLFNEVLDIVEESRQGDCLYIVTTPDTDKDSGEEIDALGAVDNLEMQEISTSYAATYYPWVKYYDEVNKKYINLPVTKDVVRNFAYTDNVSHPWFASAGMSRGNVECAKARHFTKLEEEDTLYEGMINPVKSFGTDGVKIWGNKTMYQEDTPLNRINVRRLMIRIKDLIKTASQQLVFEQNDNTVDAQFRSIVDPILANAKQNRGISDYRIKTDTSAEARDRKELPAAIYVKPINCLEYVDLTFTIYPEGTKFDE